MGELDALPIVLKALAALAAVVSVVVAIHGLNHDYKSENGRLNSHGWLMAGLIVLLGGSTLGAAFLQDQLETQKEKQEAAMRSRQFSAQMARLDHVFGSLSGLQRELKGSVAAQQIVLDRTTQSLRVSEAVGVQTRRDAESILHRIFDEANKVAPEKILLFANYSCDVGEARSYRRISLRRSRIIVTSRQAEEPPVTIAFGGAGASSVGSTSKLNSLDRLAGWRDATIKFDLAASEDYFMTLAQFNEEGLNPKPHTLMLDCPIGVTIYVNGRIVASSTGVIREPSHKQFVVDIPDATVVDSGVPSFADYRSSPPP